MKDIFFYIKQKVYNILYLLKCQNSLSDGIYGTCLWYIYQAITARVIKKKVIFYATECILMNDILRERGVILIIC